ncbi:hypothetical protein [Bradyrhizobium sp.]|uniref:hypothetical protein n=1 Tax=Bradyrhizobium sp. TaxID=376 RepID=UPI0025C0A57B|nr:hypothetical protein [Bradyrhizobium sp.]
MRDAVVKAFDINDVEHNIADQLEKEIAALTPSAGDDAGSYAPPANRAAALPKYVTHLDGATEIGRLSAEAVIREYEAAAKEIETMGQEIASRHEAITASVAGMLEDVRTTAAHFRNEAKRIFHEIESCSAITEEVRTTCDTLKKKIGVRIPPVT